MQSYQTELLESLTNYYASSGRHDLPWRQPSADGFDPYKIMVSELMLQQTQVQRVIPKYEAFLQVFPTLTAVSQATLGDVLVLWQGLGYNRRAKFLWQAADYVQREWAGIMPRTVDGLTKLPGIGRNTAGAIVAYAWDEPVVFVETNVRTVFIHHHFRDDDLVADAQILPLVHDALMHAEHYGLSPREFYWALMDYGTHLKKTVGNASRRSKHYAKQSKFEGSDRQIRGALIRTVSSGPVSLNMLYQQVADPRAARIVQELAEEGLVVVDGIMCRLP